MKNNLGRNTGSILRHRDHISLRLVFNSDAIQGASNNIAKTVVRLIRTRNYWEKKHSTKSKRLRETVNVKVRFERVLQKTKETCSISFFFSSLFTLVMKKIIQQEK